MDHKQFSSKGGKSTSPAKQAAAKANGRKKYTTTVSYRAYGEQGDIKAGTITFNHKLPTDPERRAGLTMDAVADEVGNYLFDEYVAGVEFTNVIVEEAK